MRDFINSIHSQDRPSLRSLECFASIYAVPDFCLAEAHLTENDSTNVLFEVDETGAYYTE